MSKDSPEPQLTYIYQDEKEAALEQVMIDLIEQSFINAAAN